MANEVLVWGGTGFIGRHLVSGLVADGIAVKVLTRRERYDACFSAPCFKSSLVSVITVEDRASMTRLLVPHVATSPLIFNLAGVSGAVQSNRKPVESLEGNCGIQAHLFEACEIAGNCPHVVFTSSRLVYGKPLMLPVPETAELAPQSFYAAHKICVEHYHRIASDRKIATCTICRISNPYGSIAPNVAADYGFVSNLIAGALQGAALRVFGDGGQIRDYLHIDDLVRGLRLCGDHEGARNRTLNLGLGRGISIRDAANQIGEMTGAPVIHVEWPEQYVEVESGDYIADISLAKALIGYEPRLDFREGVAQIIGSAAAGARKRTTRSAATRNDAALQIT